MIYVLNGGSPDKVQYAVRKPDKYCIVDYGNVENFRKYTDFNLKEDWILSADEMDIKRCMSLPKSYTDRVILPRRRSGDIIQYSKVQKNYMWNNSDKLVGFKYPESKLIDELKLDSETLKIIKEFISSRPHGVVIKPTIGAGSRGLFVYRRTLIGVRSPYIDTMWDIPTIMKRVKLVAKLGAPFFVQDYVDEALTPYNLDFLLWDGKVVSAILHIKDNNERYTRWVNGSIIPCPSKVIKNLEKTVTALGYYSGILNIEFNGDLKDNNYVMEINNRYSTTMEIQDELFGYDLIQEYINLLETGSCKKFIQPKTKVRYKTIERILNWDEFPHLDGRKL